MIQSSTSTEEEAMRNPSIFTRARESTLEKMTLLQAANTAGVLGYVNQQVAKVGEEGDFEYKVKVCTGDTKCAGTNSSIFITVVGEDGATKCQPLDRWFHNDFERGDNTDYTFSDVDVGKIEYIIIKMEGTVVEIIGDNEWFLESIEVEKRGETRRFPHSQWVSPNETPFFFIQCELTRLPQEDSENGRISRQVQAAQLKKVNKWSYEIPTGNGETEDMKGVIPAFLKVPDMDYDSLDHKYKWFEERYQEYLQLRKELVGVGIKETLKGFFDPIDSIEEFKEVTEAVRSLGFGDGVEKTDEDPWLDRWREDTEFGRQTLNGMNPVVIKQIREIPEKFPVTDLHVHGLLAEGFSLEGELKDGRIFMADYKILEGIPTGEYDGKKLELAPAMALFYHDHEENFMPLAIQLGQVHDEETCPIWTRKDSPEDWLLAKMWFRNADAQVFHILKSGGC